MFINILGSIKRTILGLLIVILAGLSILPQRVYADGAYIPQPGYYIYETAQQAAIFFDNNQESMVLSTSFYGDAKDFTWIVPTPSQPTIGKISSNFFTNLEEMTKVSDTPTIQSYSLGKNASEVGSVKVTVVEEKKIGYYDLKVLQATDKNALYDFLKDNNYTYPEEGKYILDDYIRLGWTFTAIKINEEVLNNASVNGRLHSGDIAPLKFTFASDKLVYPLKISGITQYMESTGDVPQPMYTTSDTKDTSVSIAPLRFGSTMASVTLYIFADHKKDLNSNNFNTIYANWINAKDINNLGTDEQGNSWVSANKKYFLTKIFGDLSYSQMEDDLYPQNAKNNHTVGVISWYEQFLTNLHGNMIWYLALVLLLFFLPIAWQFRKVSKLCRISCWASQLLSLGLKISLIIASGTYIYNSYLVDFHGAQYWYTWYQWYASSIILLFTYALPIGMVIVLLAQLIFQTKYLKK